MKITTLALALAASTAMTGTANAASFTNTYEVKAAFQANPWDQFPVPFRNVTQTFKVTFDSAKTDKPIVVYSSDTGGVFANDLNQVNFRVDSNENKVLFSFDYRTDVGNYFGTQFSTDLTGANPAFYNIGYGVGYDRVYDTQSGSVSIRLPAIDPGTSTPAVPEPATWAMMLVGFGMIGATARYRRKARTVLFA